MLRRAVLVLLLVALIAGSASAVRPQISSTEQLDGLVYNANGAISPGMASGTLTIANPASTSPLSSVKTTLPNGTTLFADHIAPGTEYTANYVLSAQEVSIPLSLKETITPTSMSKGVPQQVRLVVQLENTGSAHVTGFTYQRSLPSGLSEAWDAHDGGSLTVNGNVLWAISDLGPGEKKNLTIAFNVTPASGITFSKSAIAYDYASTLSPSTPTLTASTDTTFTVQKSHVGDGVWMVNASVPDITEFDMVLTSVSISRADATDPFNTIELEALHPDTALRQGASWTTSYTDNFGPVPVYYLKIAYDMPYTAAFQSHVTAETVPVTIAVPTPTPAPSSPSSPPYATPTPLPSPTPTPTVPPVVPDIMFISPSYGEVITGNTTLLQTSVPPSSGPGTVAYYVSANNLTWIKLGETPVSGNISQLSWNVPQLNGNYYLKAEHYDASGILKGVAYTQVLVAHETQPVGMTTTLISGTDWLMLIIALMAIMLLMFILVPYIRGRPMIYDAAALQALSREPEWMSKLPKGSLRPDALLMDIAGMDKIRMRPLSNIAEMRRLEKDFGLSAYDAMALQLAREVGATLVTADPRVADLGKRLDIKVELMEKVAVAVAA